jgi:hypothetical protein
MASNATPKLVNDLLTAGEGLCTGLEADGAAVGIKQNTGVLARPELEALKTAQGAFTDAETATTDTYAALHEADQAASTFIGTAVKIFSITLGNAWSSAWLATGLPDNSLAVPSTQDKRYATLGKFNTYLTKHPDMEVSTKKIIVTAALADTLYKAITTARKAVGDANTDTTAKKIVRDAAVPAFRDRYSAAVEELGHLLSDTDARWYKFDLNRPADPAQPAAPAKVTATALGSGRVLLTTDGARRANSFDYYRQISGTDAAPVKIANAPGPQYTVDALPAGKTVAFTVTGVNDAGEGPASDPVTVVVT